MTDRRRHGPAGLPDTDRVAPLTAAVLNAGEVDVVDVADGRAGEIQRGVAHDRDAHVEAQGIRRTVEAAARSGRALDGELRDRNRGRRVHLDDVRLAERVERFHVGAHDDRLVDAGADDTDRLPDLHLLDIRTGCDLDRVTRRCDIDG